MNRETGFIETLQVMQKNKNQATEELNLYTDVQKGL